MSNQPTKQQLFGGRFTGKKSTSSRGCRLSRGNGRFVPTSDDEDIHTANECRLTELIGPLGGKLQRLLDQVVDVQTSLEGLVRVMVERADKERDILLPVYTHFQRGQPIQWSLLLLSHAFSFKNDLDLLRQLVPRISGLPLGSGALAGNPFTVDRVPD
ncbi:L-Aspartase-like protein [Boletus reticuloceps]|uniref:L-Aspartase-like protein n=1 Tax=Boletus reticuloceps TaxID=495285 RepID=A0A8I2YEL6_9AGAM|nr:L-Aspartase-like protein [Boletus reticuloceps]